MKKIAFITYAPKNDKSVLSGTPYRMYNSLKKLGYKIEWITITPHFIGFFFKIFIFGVVKIFGGRLAFEQTKFGAWFYRIPRKTVLDKFDVIISAMASGALFKIKTNKPIIFVSDTVWSAFSRYYFDNIPSFNIESGNLIERTALNKCSHIVLASKWAKNSCCHDYGINDSKISVIEFGANIESEYISSILSLRKNKHKIDYFNVIFIGADWNRKGGEIAFNTIRWLNSNGIKTIFHIIGPKKIPLYIKEYSNVRYYGFLNKNCPDDYNRLCDIWSKADLLLLPTKAECAGIVFAEASALGVPSISYDTGGVSSYVINNVNGYLLSIGATHEQFGFLIKEKIQTGDLFNISKSAMALANSKYTWDIWGMRISNLINRL